MVPDKRPRKIDIGSSSRLVEESVLTNTMHEEFLSEFKKIPSYSTSATHEPPPIDIDRKYRIVEPGKAEVVRANNLYGGLSSKMHSAESSHSVHRDARIEPNTFRQNMLKRYEYNHPKQIGPEKPLSSYGKKVAYNQKLSTDRKIPQLNQSSAAIDDATITDIAQKAGISGKKAAQETAEATTKEVAKNIAKESDTLLSKLGKYAPTAFGVATTFWLVNKLSDNRGQQTNAQLYGQQQQYY